MGLLEFPLWCQGGPREKETVSPLFCGTGDGTLGLTHARQALPAELALRQRRHLKQNPEGGMGTRSAGVWRKSLPGAGRTRAAALRQG